MKKEDLKYQMALTLIPKIGAITAKKLISYVGSPEGVFKEKTCNLQKIPGIGEYLAKQVSANDYISEAAKEIKNMEKSKIFCTYYQDSEYPWRLKECEDGPLLLFFRGKPDYNRSKILSIVGTRSASYYGKESCAELITNLAKNHPDLIIVSGLAYGIDIKAHRSALENNLDTYGVLAHGLNTLYPSVHRDTAVKMLKTGALISDFHSYVKPERNNFLRRNRIIAGMSDATLIIESGAKGGALITAELAGSYNREVLAIPGRRNDSTSRGCNFLIKNNIASMIETASDIENLLNWKDESSTAEPRLQLNITFTPEEKLILKTIANNPDIGLDILSVRTNIPIHKLSGSLLQMELQKWIDVLPGSLYRTNLVI